MDVMPLGIIGSVAGVVELVKRAFAKDWKACAIILGAALIGGLASLAIPEISVIAGVVYGLSASGYVTIAQNASNEITVVNSNNAKTTKK